MHDLRTNTFLLVSSSVRSKQLLCFVHGQGQKNEQKPTKKNFVGFHNHTHPLTIPKLAYFPVSYFLVAFYLGFKTIIDL